MTSGGATNFDYLFKYIIIGDAAVGKSNLLLRYAHGQFKPEYQLTIGVEFGAKMFKSEEKHIEFKFGIQQVKKISDQLPELIIKIVYVL